MSDHLLYLHSPLFNQKFLIRFPRWWFSNTIQQTKTYRLFQKFSLISQIRIRIKNPKNFKVILRSDCRLRRSNDMNRGKCYPLISWDFFREINSWRRRKGEKRETPKPFGEGTRNVVLKWLLTLCITRPVTYIIILPQKGKKYSEIFSLFSKSSLTNDFISRDLNYSYES